MDHYYRTGGLWWEHTALALHIPYVYEIKSKNLELTRSLFLFIQISSCCMCFRLHSVAMKRQHDWSTFYKRKYLIGIFLQFYRFILWSAWQGTNRNDAEAITEKFTFQSIHRQQIQREKEAHTYNFETSKPTTGDPPPQRIYPYQQGHISWYF